jgi:uncharacterized protein DUF3846
MTKCVVVEVDGTARVDEFDVDTNGLNTLQSFVGGWIEAIGGTHRYSFGVGTRVEAWTCYINEEGKLHQLPPNDRATTAWANFGFKAMPGDYCAGSAVFCGAPDSEGYDTDVPKFILQYFHLED